ncbi:Dual 3',5'-cyclic-AMP and -GMP phosphodiesterase 11A [Dinochytrium kinnereticum]|nr:Dual 3',5'-cyclic-AMP and -GMP phosphodiesterase 11A [Dinochytrium kinnereticum]
MNSAVTILNSPGHNILDQLESDDYKSCLELIEHAILATDLAIYFKNKSRVMELGNGNYNASIPEHRSLLRGITMTCVDLSAMFKPWEKAKHIANSVYAEFFEQGDKERKLGLPYSSDVMNRENEGQIPKMQVDFYDHIVTPAFEAFNVVVVNAADFIVERIKANHDNWKRLRDDTHSGDYRIH